MVRLATIACLAAFCVCVSPVADAQKAPIQQGVTSGDLAQQLADTRRQSAQLNLEVDRLQSEVAELNGKVETLEFLLSQSRDEMNRMQEDDSRIGSAIEALDTENERLTTRVQQLEDKLESALAMMSSGEGELEGETAGRESETQTADAGGASEPRVVTQSTPGAGDGNANPNQPGSLGTLRASDLPGEAGPLFAEANSKLLKFEYEEAEQAFRAFLQEFGDDPQAAEAQYWLAETLYQQEAYAEAGKAYTQMIRQYPDNRRAPDALWKMARSMRRIGDTDKACNALNILPKQYPDMSSYTKKMADLERAKADCDG